jgi:hypothetical protein
MFRVGVTLIASVSGQDICMEGSVLSFLKAE